MAVIIDSIVLTGTPGSIPCVTNPQQKFTVKAVIKGRPQGATGGTYSIHLYDRDPNLPDGTSGNDLLDEILNNNVPPITPFSHTHTFSLWCNTICEVEGRLGTSGEQKPELNVLIKHDGVKKWGPRSINVICGQGAYMAKDKRK